MFKKTLLFLLASVSVSANAVTMTTASTPTSSHKVGVGFSFSGPMGISLYSDVSDSNFIQGTVSIAPTNYLEATGDYAFANNRFFGSIPTLTPFWGLGLLMVQGSSRYWLDSETSLRTSQTHGGVRIPFGMNFVIPQTPVQLSAEIAPSIIIAPINYSYMQGGLNLRVLF